MHITQNIELDPNVAEFAQSEWSGHDTQHQEEISNHHIVPRDVQQSGEVGFLPLLHIYSNTTIAPPNTKVYKSSIGTDVAIAAAISYGGGSLVLFITAHNIKDKSFGIALLVYPWLLITCFQWHWNS